MPPSYTTNDYKVGIICALPRERTAVEAMLDEIHEPQMAIAGDNNVYSFGSIGKHHVVVASLGLGTYGTVSAAAVANDIRRTFPQLKYGLMVGIAGAIPRPESDDGDIRLGDIIVGCVHGAPSIVNYHMGKDTVDGFEIRPELMESPEILSRAVAALEVQHQRLGPTYLTHLSNMLKCNPRLNQPKLRRDYYNIPDTKDRLFKAESTEPAGTSEIVRQLRYLRSPPDALTSEKFIHTRNDGFADYPAVFLGSIGSADTLMKSAIRRDAVFRMVQEQRRTKLLCFEMEASGIARGWPCLIIRGICDYCDSHKNDDWQNFAAATAAAYAKDLLLRISPEMVVVSLPVNEALGKGNLQADNVEIKPGTILHTVGAQFEWAKDTSNHKSLSPTDLNFSIPAIDADEQIALNRQLINAARVGNFAQVRNSHESGGDINSFDGPWWGPTAISAAAQGYDSYKKTVETQPPAYVQSRYENAPEYSEIIKYLIRHGAEWDNELEETKRLIRQATTRRMFSHDAPSPYM